MIIQFFLILHFCAVCQDIKPHTDGFIISREFAETIAARFDSLKFFKAQNVKLFSALDTCENLLSDADRIMTEQRQQSDLLASQIITQSEIIKSYERTEQINADLRRSLKIETRKRKGWKVAAITAAGLFGTSVLYIYLR